MTATVKRKKGSSKSSQSKHNETDAVFKQQHDASQSRKKKTMKTHKLAAQQMEHTKIRNRLYLAVLFYVCLGAGILYWRGVTKLPEIPPELQNEILGSYPQQLKDIDMPKSLKKSSQETASSDNNESIAEHESRLNDRKIKSNHSKDSSKKVNKQEQERFPDFQVHIQNRIDLSPILTKSGKVAKEWKELKHNIDSSHVRVFIMDDFLSPRECDGLMRAHENHVKQHQEHPPIVCFSDEHTMKQYLRQTKLDWTSKISAKDFVEGTLCLNESLSSVLNPHLVRSYSTSFYPGESPFSTQYEQKVQKHTGFDARNGGKFQVTSYEEGVGYKLHTDCTEGNTDARDRFSTILVYLQDVEKGGETEFTELGIKVRPKKGRALVWNNMDSEGNCDLTSYHQAAPVMKGKKYILQRWYYYQNFPMLGKRTSPPSLPARSHELTPRVTCDRFDSGSCRWYDEWTYDHLTSYGQH